MIKKWSLVLVFFFFLPIMGRADIGTLSNAMAQDLRSALDCVPEINGEKIKFCTGLIISRKTFIELASRDKTQCFKELKKKGYRLGIGEKAKQVAGNSDYQSFNSSTKMAWVDYQQKWVLFKKDAGRIDCFHEYLHLLQHEAVDHPLAPQKRAVKGSSLEKELLILSDKVASFEKAGELEKAKLMEKKIHPFIDLLKNWRGMGQWLDEKEIYWAIYRLCPDLFCSIKDKEIALANLLRLRTYLPSSAKNYVIQETKAILGQIKKGVFQTAFTQLENLPLAKTSLEVDFGQRFKVLCPQSKKLMVMIPIEVKSQWQKLQMGRKLKAAMTWGLCQDIPKGLEKAKSWSGRGVKDRQVIWQSLSPLLLGKLILKHIPSIINFDQEGSLQFLGQMDFGVYPILGPSKYEHRFSLMMKNGHYGISNTKENHFYIIDTGAMDNYWPESLVFNTNEFRVLDLKIISGVHNKSTSAYLLEKNKLHLQGQDISPIRGLYGHRLLALKGAGVLGMAFLSRHNMSWKIKGRQLLLTKNATLKGRVFPLVREFSDRIQSLEFECQGIRLRIDSGSQVYGDIYYKNMPAGIDNNLERTLKNCGLPFNQKELITHKKFSPLFDNNVAINLGIPWLQKIKTLTIDRDLGKIGLEAQ